MSAQLDSIQAYGTDWVIMILAVNNILSFMGALFWLKTEDMIKETRRIDGVWLILGLHILATPALVFMVVGVLQPQASVTTAILAISVCPASPILCIYLCMFESRAAISIPLMVSSTFLAGLAMPIGVSLWAGSNPYADAENLLKTPDMGFMAKQFVFTVFLPLIIGLLIKPMLKGYARPIGRAMLTVALISIFSTIIILSQKNTAGLSAGVTTVLPTVLSTLFALFWGGYQIGKILGFNVAGCRTFSMCLGLLSTQYALSAGVDFSTPEQGIVYTLGIWSVSQNFLALVLAIYWRLQDGRAENKPILGLG